MAHPRYLWQSAGLVAVFCLTLSVRANDEGGEDEFDGEEMDGGMDGYGDEGGGMPPGGYGGGEDGGDYGDYGDEGHGGAGGGGGSGPTLKKGVVHADAITLPLLLGKRAVLVKCDKDYPYGEKEDEYVAFAKREAVLEADFLVVEVAVNEHAAEDDAEGLEAKVLCESMGATAEDFPSFRLIRKGSTDVKEAIKYSGEIKADDLAAFVTKEAGVFLGPPGTLEIFDKLAARFVRELSQQDSILAEAKKQKGLLERERDQTYASFYISLMERMKGPAEADKCAACEKCFRFTEERRLNELNQGNVPPEKRKEHDRKLNALPAFMGSK